MVSAVLEHVARMAIAGLFDDRLYLTAGMFVSTKVIDNYCSKIKGCICGGSRSRLAWKDMSVPGGQHYVPVYKEGTDRRLRSSKLITSLFTLSSHGSSIDSKDCWV